jgi:hypothetical protein
MFVGAVSPKMCRPKRRIRAGFAAVVGKKPSKETFLDTISANFGALFPIVIWFSRPCSVFYAGNSFGI